MRIASLSVTKRHTDVKGSTVHPIHANDLIRASAVRDEAEVALAAYLDARLPAWVVMYGRYWRTFVAFPAFSTGGPPIVETFPEPLLDRMCAVQMMACGRQGRTA